MDHEEDADMLDAALFEEPADFRPPPAEPTWHTIARKPEFVTEGTVTEMRVRLPGHHSLWAHCLWNAGVYLAHYLDEHKDRVRGKCVLELGAAAALPSFISIINGATVAVATDFPDVPLIDALAFNAQNVVADAVADGRMRTLGYLWGQDVEPLMACLPPGRSRFDVMILSDLVFNHQQHDNLLKTVRLTMAEDGEALVFFTSHRPWLAHKDHAFFPRAVELGFVVDRIVEDRMPVMFEKDPGDADVRSTIHGFRIRFSSPSGANVAQ